MRDLLEKMIVGLRKQVEEKVPEKGAFPLVYEREDVTERKIGLSHLILKVTGVSLKGCEDERLLEFGAVNYPNPYGAECAFGCGSTQDILARLKDEKLLDELLEKIPRFAEDIDYTERHPWG